MLKYFEGLSPRIAIVFVHLLTGAKPIDSIIEKGDSLNENCTPVEIGRKQMSFSTLLIPLSTTSGTINCYKKSKLS